MTTNVSRKVRHPLLRLSSVFAGERWRLVLAALLGALAIGSSIGLLGTSSWLISRASQRPPVLELGVAIVIVRTCGLGRGIFRYLERLVGHDAALRGLVDLRVRVYARLADIAPAGLSGYRRGDLLARLVGDVDAGLDLPLRIWLPAVSGLVAAIGTVAIIAVILPAAGLLLAVLLLLGGTAVPGLTALTAARAERRVAPDQGALAAAVVDALAGSADLVAFGSVPRAVAGVEQTDARLTAAARRSALGTGLGSGLNGLLLAVAVVGSLALGITAVGDGRIQGVYLAVLALVPLAAWETVNGLPAAALAVSRVGAAAGRVFQVIDAPIPVPEPDFAEVLAPGPRAVELRNVAARWDPAGPFTISAIDLVLPPGHRVVVTGPSGAGKSTLAAVLVRFLPYSGSFTIDGTQADRLASDDVRRVIGLCAQDSHVFDSTLEENLRLARRDATAEEIADVLDRARLGDWVAGLPEGLATTVGAHGARLSGGQRQRLAVARALLADVAVLVLDEPTEHLEPTTAAELMADLLVATSGRTTVIVTHRLMGLGEVDEVLVLSEGKVLERGTPKDLRDSNGWYATRLAREEDQERLDMVSR
ncbi:MAG: thiol reductant ABC exporter subunit CydC [Actinomycetes bacterium]